MRCLVLWSWFNLKCVHIHMHMHCTLASQLAAKKTSHIILPQLHNITIFHPKLWKCHQSNDYHLCLSAWLTFTILLSFVYSFSPCSHECIRPIFCHNLSFRLTAIQYKRMNCIERKNWQAPQNTFGIQQIQKRQAKRKSWLLIVV